MMQPDPEIEQAMLSRQTKIHQEMLRDCGISGMAPSLELLNSKLNGEHRTLLEVLPPQKKHLATDIVDIWRENLMRFVK